MWRFLSEYLHLDVVVGYKNFPKLGVSVKGADRGHVVIYKVQGFGLPKIRGTRLRVPIIWVIAFPGRYRGPLFKETTIEPCVCTVLKHRQECKPTHVWCGIRAWNPDDLPQSSFTIRFRV